MEDNLTHITGRKLANHNTSYDYTIMLTQKKKENIWKILYIVRTDFVIQLNELLFIL
jgi:hypothetical protein